MERKEKKKSLASVNKKREKGKREREGEGRRRRRRRGGLLDRGGKVSLRKSWTTIMRFKAAVLYNNARFTLVDRDIDLAWNAA